MPSAIACRLGRTTLVSWLAVAVLLFVGCGDSDEGDAGAIDAPFDSGTDTGTGDADPGDAEMGDAEMGDAESGDADTQDAEPGDADLGDGGGCPPQDAAPLGETCAQEGVTCAYGYNPPECGGRTVRCEGGAWIEESHTDPDSSCAELVTCGDLTCGPNEYCVERCTCCGYDAGMPPSSDHHCEPLPGGCDRLDLCSCEGRLGGLCDEESRMVLVPCA